MWQFCHDFVELSYCREMMFKFINLCVMILLLMVKLSTQANFTWREAYNKCKDDNGYLELDIPANEYGPSTRLSMSQSSVWIGSVEFLSKWLDIRGCYIFDNYSFGNHFNVNTIANCEIECHGFEFFAYGTGEHPVCKCMSNLTINSTDARNCESNNIENGKNTYTYMIVYRRYPASKSYETEKENCMFMSCSPGSPGSPNVLDGPHVVSCLAQYKAHGVCANHMETNDWGPGWKRSLQQCITYYGTYFLDDFDSGCSYVRSNSWTRIFRQQRSFWYDIHSIKDVLKNHQLVKCASKRFNVTNNSWKTEYIDCNSSLQFYNCKRVNLLNSVTNAALTSQGQIQNTDSSLLNIGNKSAHEDKRLAVIIGTVAGALTVVIGVGILLLVCKVRSSGIFSKKNHHSVMKFSKETCEGSDQSTTIEKQPHVENIRSGPEIQKTKDIYAEVKKTKKTENIKTLYSEVNKTRKLSSDYRKKDDNFSELGEGEYDHLNNLDRRIFEKDSIMYDSNVGIRNIQDPMYDTTLHASRLESEDVYDHSFPNVNTNSNYDCYSSLAHTNLK